MISCSEMFLSKTPKLRHKYHSSHSVHNQTKPAIRCVKLHQQSFSSFCSSFLPRLSQDTILLQSTDSFSFMSQNQFIQNSSIGKRYQIFRQTNHSFLFEVPCSGTPVAGSVHSPHCYLITQFVKTI